ncbi:MerR family transcriptional regulator [Streptococcus cuniculi]|uniref:MerR family transcriptional regulator n=1 Tax=Streptococcus cuniculi TaxID=1432788 RepID=A0A4Y9JDL7_9STRE|nr:MerR family transcriptional regulator [Streptococcus cuniculi]MBF0777578.1 MerR family transcriptional regulator [Streptococcus cuniculi]TFU98621.1 MerR family transcriptional regulator [Streptococcus cuniculi]
MTNSEKTYTITEVSELYQLNSNTLRYYERIGLLPAVPRKPNGNRYFTKEMLNWLEMVICLRHSGIPIEVLKRYVELLHEGEATNAEREQLLREQLVALYQRKESLQRSINRLEHKISLYESGEINQVTSYFEEYAILADKETSWKE